MKAPQSIWSELGTLMQENAIRNKGWMVQGKQLKSTSMSSVALRRVLI
jgi:hypothetical protein